LNFKRPRTKFSIYGYSYKVRVTERSVVIWDWPDVLVWVSPAEWGDCDHCAGQRTNLRPSHCTTADAHTHTHTHH